MNKLLLKKIVNAGSTILALVMVLLIKVGITLKAGNESSSALYKGYFEFISDASKVDTYSFARVCMILGFVLVCVSVVYFVAILVLGLLKQGKLIYKLNLVTKIMEFVLIGAMIVILVAGFDKLEYGESGLVTHITLFGFPWVLALLFSAVPFASKYFIK